MNRTKPLFTIVMVYCLLASCTSPRLGLNITNDETLIFSNGGIRLQIDRDMYTTINYQKSGRNLSLNRKSGKSIQSLPPFYLETDIGSVNDFILDTDDIEFMNINTVLGAGRRLKLRAVSDGEKGVVIEQILSIELYDDFPNTAILSAEFKNISESQSIQLNAVFSNAYQLDASLLDQSVKPYSFYSYYGTAGRPFRQYEKLLSANFKTINFAGRPDSLEGVKQGNGGIPILDLWSRDMGLGIGHVEPVWQNIYFPIEVQTDGRVFLGIKEIPNLNLEAPMIMEPGETYSTVRSFITVHSLDFYATIETYSKLMKLQGIDMHTASSDNDYRVAWCSWNDYSTHAMASKNDVMLLNPILERLPELDDLGIQEIIFDAGWFNNQGDWLPNTDSLSFPGGERDLISAIRTIHNAGFTVRLWISFLTADAWSDVATTHPAWMIKKPDGTFHLDRWSGYTMCPSLPEVQAYHGKMARRFVEKYGADGFKLDGMYVCPPCYNPSHGHEDPNESSQHYYQVFKAFYEQAKSINKSTTIMNCPCGTICAYTTLPYISQTIAADPKTYETVRRNAKMYRALKGASTPYSSDYIDIEKGNMKFPTTFASAVGIGAVPQTFYGMRPSDTVMEIYKKWIAIYNEEMISTAQYLNLYDMHFDRPETHVFRKEIDGMEILYYSFFEDESEWSGNVEFRGLDKNKAYAIYDYINEIYLGIITGSDPKLEITFEEYLLVKCTEI